MIGRQLPYYQGQIHSYIYEGKPHVQDFCERVLQHLQQKTDFLMIDMICDELSTALKNHSSQIVGNATYILNTLARAALQPLTMRMAQKEFQENLVYTLRGRTSLLGNKLTIHPQAWEEIEVRVLSLYQFWFASLCQEEEKYHHILEKYRNLKSKGIKFPPTESSTPEKVRTPKKPIQPEVTVAQVVVPHDSINEQDLDVIDELIRKYQLTIDQGELARLLNTETVRLVKSKVTQLYTIFTTKNLEQEPKERIKGQYSKLRTILKKIDQANDQIKRDEQRRFLEQKKGAVKIKPLSQKLIQSPEKGIQQVHSKGIEANLLDEPEPVKTPVKQAEQDEFSAFQSSEPSPPTSGKKNEELLFDAIEKLQSARKQQQQTRQKQLKADLLIDTSVEAEPPRPKQPVKEIPNEIQL